MRRLGGTVLAVMLLAGCASVPPLRPLDLCAVFAQKERWVAPALAAEARWQIDVPLMMATVFHESSYHATARAPRRKILGVIPGPRLSSAYGYPQAINSTWADYQRATGRSWAQRDDIDDALDFVGWYHDGSARQLNLPRDDAYALYLAYHQGRGGYARRSFERSPRLMAYAQKVAQTHQRYREQLRSCPLSSSN